VELAALRGRDIDLKPGVVKLERSLAELPEWRLSFRSGLERATAGSRSHAA